MAIFCACFLIEFLSIPTRIINSSSNVNLASFQQYFFIPIPETVTANEPGTGILTLANGTTKCYVNIAAINSNMQESTVELTIDAIFCKNSHDNKWTFMKINPVVVDKDSGYLRTMTVLDSVVTDITGDNSPDIETVNWMKTFKSFGEYVKDYYQYKNSLLSKLKFDEDVQGFNNFIQSPMKFLLEGPN